MTPSSDERSVAPPPERCLSFTIRGPWGHFRRIDGNVVKQTYRVIPRTTVAGLVAAILGIERDGYYELFAEGASAVAIDPTSELRTINLPMNTLSTADEDIRRVPRRGRSLKVGLPDPTKPRQQHNYEVLVDPSYRIDLWLSDSEVYDELRSKLESGKSHYTPSLGLSEYLADIEYHGEMEVEIREDEESPARVDSAVPAVVDSIVPERGMNYGVERSPAFMEATEGGRRTTGFAAYGYDIGGGALQVQDVTPAEVDGRNVLFV